MSNNPFPELPVYSGNWIAIQAEILPGSGEVITAAIAVQGMNGQALVSPVLSASRIQCMFGPRAQAFEAMVQMLTTAVSEHIERGKVLSEWTPVFEGLRIVDGGLAFGQKIEDLYSQAVRLLSAFGDTSPRTKSVTSLLPQRRTPHSNWHSEVRNQFVHAYPDFKSAFGQNIVVDGRTIYLDFVTDIYFAAFGTYSPRSGLTTMKARLFELAAVRQKDPRFEPRDSEFIMRDPEIDAQAGDELRKALDELEWLKEFSKISGYPIFTSRSPAVVAEHMALKASVRMELFGQSLT